MSGYRPAVDADKAAMIARNRRILAERLHHPAGTVEAAEELEARYPGWWVWWSRDPVDDPHPGYRALAIWAHSRHETLWAAAPDILAKLIEDADRHRPSWWR